MRRKPKMCQVREPRAKYADWNRYYARLYRCSVNLSYPGDIIHEFHQKSSEEVSKESDQEICMEAGQEVDEESNQKIGEEIIGSTWSAKRTDQVFQQRCR